MNENPYQSPQSLDVELPVLAEPVEVNWKSILKCWEMFRLPYNLAVGMTGLLVLVITPPLSWEILLGGAIGYGLCANVMFLLGPIATLYFQWFVDAWEHRFVPRWLARFVRSAYLIALIFSIGTLFSIGLTLLIGLIVAMEQFP